MRASAETDAPNSQARNQARIAQWQAAIPRAFLGSTLGGLGRRSEGKVRDVYQRDDGLRVLVATDRFSAFDRVLGAIPYRGQVLNQLSAWWFEQTADIVANHVVAVPHGRATVCR